MSVKDELLRILEENRGRSLSGESIAQSLGVSRTSVWKAINALRSEGYTIEAVTNRGYMLPTDSDILSEAAIRLHLQEYSDIPLFVYKQVDSTNKEASRKIIEGTENGTFIVAEEQTAGRGRLGRTFHSPASGGVYMSIIARPDFDISKSVLVTVAASVAVMRALRKLCNIQCSIKWVNDVYYLGEKICGILTEAVTDFESGQIKSLIIGIGINCSTENLPEEIQKIAGAVPLTESRNKLAAQVYIEMMHILENIEDREFIDDYIENSLVLGKDVSVIKFGKEPVGAHVKEIDRDGSLIVEYTEGSLAGTVETLSTGEISIRPQKAGW